MQSLSDVGSLKHCKNNSNLSENIYCYLVNINWDPYITISSIADRNINIVFWNTLFNMYQFIENSIRHSEVIFFGAA